MTTRSELKKMRLEIGHLVHKRQMKLLAPFMRPSIDEEITKNVMLPIFRWNKY